MKSGSSMNRRLHGPAAVWIALLAIAGPVEATEPATADEPTHVILVRHAEKQTDGSDPSLSAAGKERARALVAATADLGIGAIYSTQYARTRETVAPLAEHLDVEVSVLPIGKEGIASYLEALGRRILEEHSGGTVLAVGHSNTVPGLARALGVAAPPELTESDYDDLFVVIVDAPGSARLLHLHYGPSSP